MTRREKYYFTLYHNGCQILMSVVGRPRYLRERNFLDRLVGRTPQHATADRAIQHPTRNYDPADDAQYVELDRRISCAHDFFPLENWQFDEFLTFRREMDAEFGRPASLDEDDRAPRR